MVAREAALGERERGLRRVTMLTGGLAAVSIAGTVGVAMAAHAEHVADQETNVPAGSVGNGPAGQTSAVDPGGASAAVEEAPQAPPADVGTAGETGVSTGTGTPADDPEREQAAPAGAPAPAEFPPVTGGGGGPGQATSGGS
ncbi:hypothetical protein ACN27F_05605 [Solwaraspora sp. WMMB335]|uniref:hypothetical protein n=1 Tax=Solwaraspora sp. WMMB335 TaxID=3404118 RepID=UPI003B965669